MVVAAADIAQPADQKLEHDVRRTPGLAVNIQMAAAPAGDKIGR